MIGPCCQERMPQNQHQVALSRICSYGDSQLSHHRATRAEWRIFIIRNILSTARTVGRCPSHNFALFRFYLACHAITASQRLFDGDLSCANLRHGVSVGCRMAGSCPYFLVATRPSGAEHVSLCRDVSCPWITQFNPMSVYTMLPHLHYACRS